MYDFHRINTLLAQLCTKQSCVVSRVQCKSIIQTDIVVRTDIRRKSQSFLVNKYFSQFQVQGYENMARTSFAAFLSLSAVQFVTTLVCCILSYVALCKNRHCISLCDQCGLRETCCEVSELDFMEVRNRFQTACNFVLINFITRIT